jgi:hypothetical protein
MSPFRLWGPVMLEVACRRCERRGRLSFVRLIAEHGSDTDLPRNHPAWAACLSGVPEAIRTHNSTAMRTDGEQDGHSDLDYGGATSPVQP